MSLRINDTIDITIEVALKNETLKNLMFDFFGESTIEDVKIKMQESVEKDPNWHLNIPLMFPEYIIQLMIEFTKYHIVNPIQDLDCETLSLWDLKFIESIIKTHGVETIYNLFTFADYIHNDGLISILALWIAKHDIAGLSVRQMRKKFNIAGDLTKEEEDTIIDNTKWIQQYAPKELK